MTQDMVQRGISERKACQAMELSRSSYRYEVKPSTATDQELRGELRELAQRHKRYGYRRMTALLRRDAQEVNAKRVWRLWKEEKLTLPRKRPRRRRPVGFTNRPRLATHRNEVWSYDFIYDRAVTGETLKMFAVVDECTRECRGIYVQTKITAEGVSQALEAMFKAYGKPQYVRSDNGPEFISDPLRTWLLERGVRPMYIEPGQPWENGFIESFNGKFRDECLNTELFWGVEEAQVIVEVGRRRYNYIRPHSALGYRTPQEAALCPVEPEEAFRGEEQGVADDEASD